MFVDVCRRPPMSGLPLSHGENRGSSPLGSANDFHHLAEPTRSNEGSCLAFGSPSSNISYVRRRIRGALPSRFTVAKRRVRRRWQHSRSRGGASNVREG